MLARLNDANKARLRGTASNEEFQRAYNGIRAGFLDLVNWLTEADFEASKVLAADAVKLGPRQDNVLYRIPNQFQKIEKKSCPGTSPGTPAAISGAGKNGKAKKSDGWKTRPEESEPGKKVRKNFPCPKHVKMSLRTFCPCPHLCPTQYEGQCMSP